MERHGFGFFAVELRDTGELIGMVGLSHVPFEAHFTPCVEIGWRIAAAHWNRGLATEGARECLRYAHRGARAGGGSCVHGAGESAVAARDGETRHDAESRRMISITRVFRKAIRCADMCCTAPDCYNRNSDEVQHFSSTGEPLRLPRNNRLHWKLLTRAGGAADAAAPRLAGSPRGCRTARASSSGRDAASCCTTPPRRLPNC